MIDDWRHVAYKLIEIFDTINGLTS